MANIPGATSVLPGAYSETITQSRGVSVPGSIRIAAVIGEGSTPETIVAQAYGGGQDGLNSTYTSTSGADGRHFRLSAYPVISNRTTLFKNGIPLVGLESTIDSNPFSYLYDYRIDITTGKIELQRTHLQDQGGAYYVPLATNVGLGVINGLALMDQNAPPETWTIRCVSVQRNALNQPIGGTAKFVAIGSISGAKLDGYGNPVIWTANNQTVSNGVLSFAIDETKVLSVVVSAFREGDAFTIITASGVLVKNDTLTAEYIPEANINDPLTVEDMIAVVNRHGYPSTDNNLSLGAQLAFANNASVLVTCQAAPPMPRRTSYILTEDMDSSSTDDDDFIFPLPTGVVPDFNSNIHFFITNNTDQVETQILPNKLDYYLLDTAGYPTTHAFITDDIAAPAGYSYFYTVKSSDASLVTGFDGYIARNPSYYNTGVFSSSVTFDSTYVGKVLKIVDATNVANQGNYTINSVSGGKLYVTTVNDTDHHYTASPYFVDFTTESSGVSFQVIDVSTGSTLDGYSGTDGYLTNLVGTATATFGSVSLYFDNVPSILTRRLRVTGSDYNNGLYDITGYDSGTNLLTIRKTVVDESDMRYEVLDTSIQSQYIVINHNVVPTGSYRLRVTIVDERDASFYDAGWINALESLELIECDMVVPLPKQTISVIFQNALSHCKSMSNIRNRKERVLLIGAISGLTPDNLNGDEDAAVEDIGILEGIQGDNITEVLAGNIEDLADYSVSNAFGNTYRCVYFCPDQIVVQAGTENVMVDGFYIAAAAAGYLSADNRIENPLTNKTLSGFTILRNKQYSQLTMEKLAASGVCIVQPVSGGGNVKWGITTTQSGYPEEQEISIIFIRDRIAKSLRTGFQGFAGQPERGDTQVDLYVRAGKLLDSFVTQGLITAYADLSVKRDSVEPRQWNITVKVQPTYPVNWIYIKVNVGQI